MAPTLSDSCVGFLASFEMLVVSGLGVGVGTEEGALLGLAVGVGTLLLGLGVGTAGFFTLEDGGLAGAFSAIGSLSVRIQCVLRRL